jgi:hypothetical protein
MNLSTHNLGAVIVRSSILEDSLRIMAHGVEFERTEVELPGSRLLGGFILDVKALAGLRADSTFPLTKELFGEVLWAEVIGKVLQ